MRSDRVEGRRSTLRVGLDMRLAAYRRGGIARYAEQLAAALRTLDGVDLVPFYSMKDPRARDGHGLRTPAHHRLEEWAVPVELLLQRARLDIYHSPDFISPRLRAAIRVATVHDLAFLTWPAFLPPDALNYYGRLEQSYRWTDGWIAPSKWTAEALQTAYDIPSERIEVVPHGVPSYLAGREPLPFDTREPFILAVSTVEPRKNYDLLLDALEVMPDPPQLIIAGGQGWQADATVDRIRRARGVQWLENADDAALKRLYRKATAVAVPSYAEGFGFSALEAMACGTPVISSGGGALPEVTAGTALEPANQSPEDWSETINQLREDRGLWERLSQAGYDRSEQFSWERAARQTLAFYRRLSG